VNKIYVVLAASSDANHEGQIIYIYIYICGLLFFTFFPIVDLREHILTNDDMMG